MSQANRWVRAIKSVYRGEGGDTDDRNTDVPSMAAAIDDDAASDLDDDDYADHDDDNHYHYNGGRGDSNDGDTDVAGGSGGGAGPVSAKTSANEGVSDEGSTASYRAEAAELLERNQALQTEIAELEAQLAGAKGLL